RRNGGLRAVPAFAADAGTTPAPARCRFGRLVQPGAGPLVRTRLGARLGRRSAGPGTGLVAGAGRAGAGAPRRPAGDRARRHALGGATLRAIRFTVCARWRTPS